MRIVLAFPRTRTRLATAVVTLAALLACSRAQSVPPPSTAAPPTTSRPQPAAGPATEVRRLPRIVFLGDSLTAGYGLASEQAVPALVQDRLEREGLKYEVVNAGVSGDTSAGGLSRLDWSLEGPVRVLVLELGANDGLRGLPVQAMKGNLDTIIRRTKARGIRVLLTGMEAPPNYGQAYTLEFRQAFRELADTHRVAFVPFYLSGVAGNPRLNIGDGIHPNPEGARIVHDTIWRALRPLLSQADGAGLEDR
jgi:acyl-CoA thioesterase-1